MDVLFSKLGKCFYQKTMNEEGVGKRAWKFRLQYFQEKSRVLGVGPSVIDHFPLVLVSLILGGPPVLLWWGKQQK